MNNVMRKLFEPESVAVIGASSTPGKPGNVLLKNIRDNNFPGKVYGVNPRGGEIEGYPIFKSIDELPDGIDQAIITLPAQYNPDTVRACGAKGIEMLILAASGFAEVDHVGGALQEDLAAAIAESNVRVLGPNTTGHVSMPASFTSSFFALGQVPRGRISYITQTGNFSGISLRHIMSAENYGVARVAGLGNKIDIDESEILEYLGDDPETAAVLLYLENIKHPSRFLEVAAKVTRKKPVILLKGGSSDAGAAAALAHTASLASDDRILDGALAQAGVTRIYKYSHLFQVAKALAVMPVPAGNRISFLSPSGAFTVCMTDYSRSQGLEVPRISEKTRKRLQAMAPPFIRMRNPVDIFGSVGAYGYEEAYGDAIDAVLSDKTIDAVVVIMMLTEESGIPDYDFLVDLAKKHPKKPIYVTFMGDHVHNVACKAYLEPRGVPCYMLVEEAFEVLGVLARCRTALRG